MPLRSQYHSPLPGVSAWRALALAAAAVTALFVVLILSQWLAGLREMETVELRELEVVSAELPAPPEPPRETPEEPPPPRWNPPRLELEIEPMTPSLPVLQSEPLSFQIDTAPFQTESPPLDIAPETPSPPRTAPRVARQTPNPAPRPPREASRAPTPPPPPPEKTVYEAGELDSRPRLRNRPSAPFPASVSRDGVSRGEVVLYVEISPEGRARVLEVLSASHSGLATMAREVARKARFTRPTKNGRPVKALFRWPLVLKK